MNNVVLYPALITFSTQNEQINYPSFSVPDIYTKLVGFAVVNSDKQFVINSVSLNEQPIVQSYGANIEATFYMSDVSVNFKERFVPLNENIEHLDSIKFTVTDATVGVFAPYSATILFAFEKEKIV